MLLASKCSANWAHMNSTPAFSFSFTKVCPSALLTLDVLCKFRLFSALVISILTFFFQLHIVMMFKSRTQTIHWAFKHCLEYHSWSRSNTCLNIYAWTPDKCSMIRPYTQSVFEFSFFILETPSCKTRSTAAATVRVPPITAQSPVRNPAKLLLCSSRLITFIGDMSYNLLDRRP